MRLSIIVVSWSTPDLLPACLAALSAHAPEAEVVVVDNASGDAPPRLVRDSHRTARVITLEQNRGFAGGCNAGAQVARGELLLFMNPDVETQPGSIQDLARVLVAAPRAGAAGGLLVGEDGRPQERYAPLPFPPAAALARAVLAPGGLRRRIPIGASPRNVDHIAGACLMMKRSAFEQLSGFDERFHPVWFEDLDLCRRLWAAGWEVLFHPGARFAHRGGASVARMDPAARYSAWYRNLLLYTRKHHGSGAAVGVRLLTVPGAMARAAGSLLTGQPGRGGRARRASAYLRVAGRSLAGWSSASRSTS